jgi:hypothetical protein
MIDIKVTQGDTHVNSITKMYESKDCVIYHVDTKTKKPLIDCVFDNYTIRITRPDYWDVINQQEEATEVSFDVPEDWYIVTQAGRYHVNVALYKRLETNEENVVWWNEMK